MECDGLIAEPYRPDLAPDLTRDWDAVTEAAAGGTVLHSRRFLDYHGDRFRDLSLVARRPDETRVSMIFPLAADRNQPDRVVSHPGSSFGGIVSLTRDPAQQRALLRGAARWLQGQGFRRLLYRMAPAAVLRLPDDGLMPDLLRLGRVVQLDLWAVLPLAGADRAQAHWRTRIRRAERKGLTALPVTSPADWAALHAVIATRLDSKYGRAPVHSLAELIDLHARLGPQSRALLVRDPAGAVLAGLWFIDYGTGTVHNQYNGSTKAGLAVGASGYGFSWMLERAKAEGFRQFSFGRSTLDDGWSENAALLQFKTRFGAGLASQFHFELDLDRLALLRA